MVVVLDAGINGRNGHVGAGDRSAEGPYAGTTPLITPLWVRLGGV